jgi:hypothetical protein
MRAQAGFDPQSSKSYYLIRAEVDPPPELLGLIFPKVSIFINLKVDSLSLMMN